jgi:UDP-2-acetamido-3-amino-2,3-dideoxy-glucuronate N-acetyltransferase
MIDLHPSKSSNPPQRNAVIGCGYWGKNLIRNFANLGALSAVSDINPESAAKYASEYGVEALSFDQVLDSNIPSLVIATPAELHYKLARQGLEAGKHVFVEKPLALAAREAEELCQLAEHKGQVLMVGHLLQYHPAFLKLKELVHDGTLGELQYVYSNRLNLGKIRREENSLWSFAPHDISMILSLVGEEPDTVTATGAAYQHETIADVTTTQLTFPGGVRGHVFVSWLHPFKEQKLVVVGCEGMAVFDDTQPWQGKVQYYAHKIEIQDDIHVAIRADAINVELVEDEPLKLECQHFLDCVATGETPRTGGREGLRVLKVLQAAQDSLDAECI